MPQHPRIVRGHAECDLVRGLSEHDRTERSAIPRDLSELLVDEPEVHAARLFTLIHEKGTWTGVTWREIMGQIKPEYEARVADDDAVRSYYDQLRKYDKAIGRYRLLCVVTLGIYRAFAKRPVEPTEPQRQSVDIFTGVFLTGPRFVANGLHGLIADGLIRKETVGEGEDAEDVFYPTVQLAQRLAPYAQPN